MNASIFKTLSVAALFLLVSVLTVPTAQAVGTQWTYPAIAKYGPGHPLPHAAVQPDNHRVYKAIFDVTTGFKDPSEPEAGLDHVARAVNIFAAAGVSVKNLRFVAILHGPATTAVLNNAAYKAKYGVDNPNIPLIDALRKAGVYVDVCGQALADMGIEHSEVYQNVRIDLSALATTVIYGDMGYAYMKQ